MAIDRAHIAENLWPGIKAHFGLAYNDWPNEYKMLFETQDSDKAYEELVREAGFGLAVEKTPGDSVVYDDASNVWVARFENRTFALGFAITREAVEDDQYFDWAVKGSKALKRSMLKCKEIRGANIFNNGFNTAAAYAGGDGKPLFSATHPLKSGGTLSNLGSAADLAETPLEAAITAIGDWVDERGLKVNVKPVRLVVANGGQWQAERLLYSEGRTATDYNDLNAVRRMNAIPNGWVLNHYLTDADAWFVITDAPDGLIHFQRRELDVEQGEGMDNQVLKVIATERYSFGWADYCGAFGNAGL